MRVGLLLRGLILGSALLLFGCGSAREGDGASGAENRADLGPVFLDADALLEALDVAGIACDPETVEEKRKWDEHTGSCDLVVGGRIYWQIDLGAATKPPQTPNPGELGSGEESPRVHEVICEHYGSQIVLGPNWMIFGPKADLTPVAHRLGAYLFAAACGDAVEAICERDDFSGTRIFLTVSPDGLSVEPTEVPSGRAVLCIGATQRGRAYVAEFSADPAIDLSELQARGSATRNTMWTMPGVAEQSGIAITVEPGAWSEESAELQPGYRIYLALLLPRDSVPELPPNREVPTVVLTVAEE